VIGTLSDNWTPEEEKSKTASTFKSLQNSPFYFFLCKHKELERGTIVMKCLFDLVLSLTVTNETVQFHITKAFFKSLIVLDRYLLKDKFRTNPKIPYNF